MDMVTFGVFIRTAEHASRRTHGRRKVRVHIPVLSMTSKRLPWRGRFVSVVQMSLAVLIPTNKVSTDNVETLSAVAKLAGEIDESASDVVVYGKVR